MADQASKAVPDANVPERRGSSASYGADYYRHYWGAEGPYERNEAWMAFFSHIAGRIATELQPSTVLDAGCAMGLLVEELVERGVDASGVDISEYAIAQVDESIADRCWQGSLTEPLPRRYDLILCIEVLEHLEPGDAAKAMANLCAAGDRILFSSSPEDFGEPTHFNVRAPEDWSADFAAHGFFRDLGHDFSELSRSAALYVKRNALIPDVVRDYDRAHYRLAEEVREVRSSLIDVRGRLERHGTNVDELKGELLRLRDELVHLQIEAGDLRGANAELRARLAVNQEAAEQLARVATTRWWRLRALIARPYQRFLASARRSLRRS